MVGVVEGGNHFEGFAISKLYCKLHSQFNTLISFREIDINLELFQVDHFFYSRWNFVWECELTIRFTINFEIYLVSLCYMHLKFKLPKWIDVTYALRLSSTFVVEPFGIHVHIPRGECYIKFKCHLIYYIVQLNMSIIRVEKSLGPGGLRRGLSKSEADQPSPKFYQVAKIIAQARPIKNL